MDNKLYQKSGIALALLFLGGCYKEGRVHPQALEGPSSTEPVEGGDGGNCFQAPVPEPMTIALLGGGLAVLAASRRRSRKNG